MGGSEDWNVRLAFLDTETTGLDPQQHRVIELALVITSPWPEMRTEVDYVQKLKIPAADIAAANPKALEVNGYTAERWQYATESNIAFWARIHGLLQGATLVCQNFAFDSSFVAAELARYKLRPPWDRRHVELYSYCHLIADELDVKDAQTGRRTWNLQSVYRAMGLPELPEHEAHPDVQRTMAIYRYVRERWAAGSEAHPYTVG